MSWWLILANYRACRTLSLSCWFYLMHDYQRARVLTLFDPEKEFYWERDITSGSPKLLSVQVALWGKGWMQGTQSQLEFLPEPHTDFIFAVLSEEYGMVGFLILLAIYLFIIARGLMIGVSAQSAFGRIFSWRI